MQTVEAYTKQLRKHAVLPDGFLASTTTIPFTAIEIKKRTEMGFSLITASAPAHFAALSSTNSMCSPAIRALRSKHGKGKLQSILINNCISNVGHSSSQKSYHTLCKEIAELTPCSVAHAMSLSTGVIGWQLPVSAMLDAIPSLVQTLQSKHCFDVAHAMLTTDTYAKIRSKKLKRGRIVGLCKGAGMVEPNMATTFLILLTDIAISSRLLKRYLQRACRDSFNALSIDGDQSTSDVALILSSGRHRMESKQEFQDAISEVAGLLADDLVRGGEGTSHAVKVIVRGAWSKKTALSLGRCVLNSRLIGTAIAGNDPNTGRLIARVGSWLAQHSPRTKMTGVTIALGQHTVFHNGAIVNTSQSERVLSDYLKQRQWEPANVKTPPKQSPVEIHIDLPIGRASATVIGSDLTADYVRINGDYRT